MNDPVADELAIRSLTAEYTDAINRGDVDDAIRTYARESTFTMTDRPAVTGREAIGEVRLPEGWRFAARTFVARYLGDVDLSGPVVPDRGGSTWEP